jgi:hypothetical protein
VYSGRYTQFYEIVYNQHNTPPANRPFSDPRRVVIQVVAALIAVLIARQQNKTEFIRFFNDLSRLLATIICTHKILMECKIVSKKTEMEVDLMASLAGYGLISVAQNLRQIEDENPEQFALVAKLLGIERRDAAVMARIARIYKELEMEEVQIAALGWPKLVILSDYIAFSNQHRLLELAEKMTAKDLARILIQQPAGTKPVVFYFTDEEYHRLEKAVLAHGAVRRRRSPDGLSGKEEALLKALSAETS